MQGKIVNTECWGPTKESLVKFMNIHCENSINVPQDRLDGKTFYEHAILSGKVDEILKLAPEIKISPMFKDYMRLLGLKKQELIYTSVYARTGGILNLFNPPVKESMDLDLKILKKQISNFSEVIKVWKDTNSELWSNLPPKLVWGGGGKLETELLIAFSKEISIAAKREEFNSQGDAVIFSIKFLRGWQFRNNPICNNKKPFDVIIEERQEIYNRKSKLLKDMGIKFDFI